MRLTFFAEFGLSSMRHRLNLQLLENTFKRKSVTLLFSSEMRPFEAGKICLNFPLLMSQILINPQSLTGVLPSWSIWRAMHVTSMSISHLLLIRELKSCFFFWVDLIFKLIFLPNLGFNSSIDVLISSF